MDERGTSGRILVISSITPELHTNTEEIIAAMVVTDRIVLVPSSHTDALQALGHLARAVGGANEKLVTEPGSDPVELAKRAAFPTLFAVVDEVIMHRRRALPEMMDLAAAAMRAAVPGRDGVTF